MLAVLIAWLVFRAVGSAEGGSLKSLAETKTWTSILPLISGAALGFGLSAPAWLALFDYVQGSARGLQSAAAHWQWIVPWRALPAFMLPCWTVNWADFSTRYLPHNGTELACGLAAPAAIVAGFLRRPDMLLRRVRWELMLLVVLLLLCMAPTAGVFRWSFRWLPFLHLVLALCAAHVIQLRPRLAVGSMAFLLLILVTIPMSIFSTGGDNGATLTWIYFQIAAIWALFELFLPIPRVRDWAPPVATFAFLLATYICIAPNCGVPKYNLSQELLNSAPLDPHRLYLSIYSEPEHAYRIEKKPQQIGQLTRLGSTAMWAGLRFVNGYSPILPRGIARDFDFRIHGEINLHEAEYLVWEQSKAGALLEQIGVDGLVIAWDAEIDPALGADWEFVTGTDEGAIYHRIGEPLPVLRSVNSIDSRPGESFGSATISNVEDTRNHVTADVDVPSNGPSALLTFSRAYFPGYSATIGNRMLRVDSYRELFPMIEAPAGSHGRLTLIYRPWWLVGGGALSIFCAALWLFGIFRVAQLRSA